MPAPANKNQLQYPIPRQSKAAGSGEGRALDLGQAFYHFSTQPDDTAHYGAVRNELKNGKSVDKTAQANTEQNQTIRLRANFKIGALNHSAT
ncbi:MAG: hypothetical protein WB689_12360, partial [Xanthobacteraceae bacterium]